MPEEEAAASWWQKLLPEFTKPLLTGTNAQAVRVFATVITGISLVMLVVAAAPGVAAKVNVAVTDTLPLVWIGGALGVVGLGLLVYSCTLPVQVIVDGSSAITGTASAKVTAATGTSTGGLEPPRVREAKTEVRWPHLAQRARVNDVRIPHGTRGRDMWVVVSIGGLHYPDPLTLTPHGTLTNGEVRLGHDGDAGRPFDVEVCATSGAASTALWDYYERAKKKVPQDFAGIEDAYWPKDVETLFTARLVRE